MPRPVRLILYIVVPLILLSASTSSIMEWLWMSQLGYEGVFWTLKVAKFALSLVAFVVGSIFLVWNARLLADQLRWANFAGTPLQQANIDLGNPVQHRRAKQILTGAALLVALLFALGFYLSWDASLRFLWNEPFGQVDPIFGKDIGYYMFRLPFWELVQTSFTVLVFLAIVFLGGVYAVTRLIEYRPGEGIRARPAVINQLKMNAALWLVLLAGGLFLDRYQILFSPQGIIFGAGYADVHVVLPALYIMLALVVVLAGLLFVSRWKRVGKLIPITAVLLGLAWVLGRVLLPGAVQQFRVAPNELELERPYLEHNISMTRLAYDLHNVREVDYEADDTLTVDDIQNNRDAIDNIRLWDPRLLIQTYKQLQEIRSYYEFYNVDNDRYVYDGSVNQVMLSAREISTDLPGDVSNWVNSKLQFTHGYGMTMSPVTETNQQGEPSLIIRDLPPTYDYPELEVDNPAIYYGEQSGDYYIVNTGISELDFPSGDENAYTRYAGQGGIPFSTWFHKLLFAWELGDINILLSDYIQPESRLQIWRGVQDRIRRITPFLRLDSDPYLVLSSGRLYWIQDAYTTSNKFPYSQPFQGFNYIRNSVKIVVDAYEGSVDYYVIDEEDPVLQVYESIFPNLFKSRSELPDQLERQFRYPQDLFEVQLQRFNRYHMTSPQVFYNNEDLWTRPMEKYGGQQILMEPYYVLARLPVDEPSEPTVVPASVNGDRANLEFMLISPLTPENRDNMIAWMAAKSDPEVYGDLVVYKLPKQRLIYGPAQIEARIDQDPEISQQLALWDQRGSRVIRGNLMIIPVESSFLYVEPVFLLAEGVDIPQLQRVIVAIGDDIAMEPTLDEALFELFGDVAAPLAPERALQQGMPVAPPDSVVQVVSNEELERVRELWSELRQAFESGDWTRYGEVMGEIDGEIGEN
ncbi:MAG: UPF0182 family protein [Rhodothermales bacterium]